MEEWRIIEEFPNYYISNLGNIKRRDGFAMKQKTENGYKRIGLTKNGEQSMRFVHRLVAAAFIPNPKNLPQVNHINENKADNCVENLEWTSSANNTNYGTRNQRVSEKMKNKPLTEEHKKKLSESAKKRKVENLDTGEIFNSLKEAGDSVKLTYQSVAAVCRGVRPTAGGYRWKYYED